MSRGQGTGQRIKHLLSSGAMVIACGIAFHGARAEAPPQSGASLFDTHCASCHGAQRGGGQFGPPVRGKAFQAKWRAAGAAALQEFMERSMPPGGAGTLSNAEYGVLTAFLLDTPAGAKPQAAADPKSGKADASAALNDVFEARHVGPVPTAPEVFNDMVAQSATAERKQRLARLTPVTDAMLTNPPATDWLSWRGTQGTTSFSPLASIDRKNVAKLQLAWSWTLPASSNEAAPLIHDGVMFVQSGEAVEALDARDGTLLWRYKAAPDPKYRGVLNELHRNFALYGNHVLVATADRHVFALDMRDGHVVWRAPVAGSDQPGQITSAGPIVAQGKIIQQTTLGPQCLGGCALVGLDAETGKQLWRTLTIAAPGEPGGDTWNGAPLSQRRGAGSWVTGSFDPVTGLVYAGTGGTYMVTPLLSDPQKGQTNDALYTNSTLALDINDGRIMWHHQHMPREVWDLDEAFERSLIRIPVDGKMQDVMATIGKLGIIDVLDRRSGKFLFAYDLGVQDLIASIDPVSGRRTVKADKQPKADQPTAICPSAEGARNWQTTAFNPQNSLMFVPMGETCMNWFWKPADPATSDGIDIGWSLNPDPRAGGNFGRIDAVDLAKRKTLWSIRQRAPIASSLLSTAGGVLFVGDRARYFRALDDRTGAPLWSVRLNAIPSSSPATYSVDGQQYVVVVAGGGGPHDSQSVPYTPEITDSSSGVTVWVFTVGGGKSGK